MAPRRETEHRIVGLAEKLTCTFCGAPAHVAHADHRSDGRWLLTLACRECQQKGLLRCPREEADHDRAG